MGAHPVRAWAAEHLRGIENVTLPSFTAGLEDLDEAAIRADVRHAADQGFRGTMAAVESCAMTEEERLRFAVIVADEARAARLNVAMYCGVSTEERELAAIRAFEAAGGTHVLMGIPSTALVETAEDLYELMRRRAAATGLGVVLHVTDQWTLGAATPKQLNLELVARIAALPTVVGVKVGAGTDRIATFVDLQRRVADDVLVSCTQPGLWPTLIPRYGMRWAVASMYDVWQTPDLPRFVELFDALVSDDEQLALDRYWQLAPLRATWQELTARHAGLYPYLLWKYAQWLVGKNGGLLRPPVVALVPQQRRHLTEAMCEVGIPVEGEDADFARGRHQLALAG